MVDKFKSQSVETDWVEEQHFASSDEAIRALKDTAPDFRCPVCSTDIFVLEEDFEKKLRTAIIRHQLPSLWSENFDTLVSISCDNCGYVMSFNEERLKRKLSNDG